MDEVHKVCLLLTASEDLDLALVKDSGVFFQVQLYNVLQLISDVCDIVDKKVATASIPPHTCQPQMKTSFYLVDKSPEISRENN